LVDGLKCFHSRNWPYANNANLFLFLFIFLNTNSQKCQVFPSAYVETVDPASTFAAKVLYDFAAEHDGTLALHASDVVTVCKAPDNGWWEGYLNGRWGLFPTSYVERLDTSASTAAAAVASSAAAPQLPPESNSVDAVPVTPGDDDDASGKRNTFSSAKKDKKGRSGGTHKRITQEMIIRDEAAPSPSPTGTSDGGETKQRGDSRDAELKKREFELKEREAELAERESELGVNEMALQKKQVKLKKRESEVAEQKQSLDRLEQELQERKEKLDDADEDLRKREAKLKKKESDVRDKKKEVEHKELELEKKSRDLQRRQKEVTFQAEELAQQQAAMAKASVSRESAREDAVKRAEARLAQQNDEIARMQQELSEKEYALQQRDAELGEREREIQEKSAALAARAAVVRSGTVSGASGGPRRTASAAPLSAVKIDPNLSPEARKQVLRQTVIEEIVATEADYVGDLELVVTRCLEPARQRGIISQQDLARLFSNIEQIWRSNSAVLAQLVQRNDPTDSKVGLLGDVLEGMAETLRSYAGYCANQDTSVAAYLKLKENPDVEKHLDELEKDLQGHDLCGFLIKPVQRLCKYPLLIRELSKYTDESHRDFAGLQRAEKAVGDAVQHVNDYQKRLEATARLAELQAEFIGVPAGYTINSPDHSFLFEAVVNELVDAGSNTSEERSLFLFSDALLIAKPHTRQKLHAYKTHVPIAALRTKDLPTTPQAPHGVLVQSAVERSVALMLNFANAGEKKKFFEAASSAVANAASGGGGGASAAAAGGGKPAVAAAPASVKRGPSKPVLPANPSPEQYKAFMRAKYEYEQWENEQLRKATATPDTSPKMPRRVVPTPAGQPQVPPGTPPQARRAANATAPAVPLPPPLATVPPGAPPSPPPEEGGGKKRLCRKCNERKPVAKVTLNDGSTCKVCDVCLKDFSVNSDSPPPPPKNAGSDDSPVFMSSKRAGTLKTRTSGRLETAPAAAAAGASSRSGSPSSALPLPQQSTSAPNLVSAAPPVPPPVPPASGGALLPGWHETMADDGRVYYYHETTNETTWDRPSAPPPAALPPPPSLSALPSMLPPPIVGATGGGVGRGSFRGPSGGGRSPMLAPARR
jgi:hypothetical protein